MERTRRKRARRPSIKSLALLISLLVVIGAAVGGTVAFLADKTPEKVNTFTPSKVTTTVEEKLDGDTKKNVKIQNTGDTTAWIRAAVVITWQDDAGNVYGQAPVAGTDYTISYDLSNGWVEGKDGFYYWTMPVESGNLTGVLITTCKEIEDKAPEGYHLTVEILGSAVQYQPEEAFTAWAGNSGLQIAADGKTLEKKAGDAG